MARKKRPKDLTKGERSVVQGLVAIGLRSQEIADRLDLEVEAVEQFAAEERRYIHSGAAAHDYQRLMARALQLELAEAMRCRDKYRALLPDQISTNGQQRSHLAHFGRYRDASDHVLRVHDRLSRAVDQLAKSDGSYRDGGGLEIGPVTIEIAGGDDPELGDLPARSDERVSLEESDE